MSIDFGVKLVDRLSERFGHYMAGQCRVEGYPLSDASLSLDSAGWRDTPWVMRPSPWVARGLLS